MRFGTIVKYHRERLGLTQTELANKLGVSTSAVGMWERTTRVPNDILLHKLAVIFDISIDELLGFEPISEEELSVAKKNLIEKIKLLDETTVSALAQIADSIIQKRGE